MNDPILVIGAGAAGLSCAISLREAGRNVLLLEEQSEPGGRIRTEDVEGFRLDHGFQAFQTAYPEAQRLLDYDQLQLTELEPGALVRKGRKWVRMSDPLRRPKQALSTLFNSIGNFADRLRLWRLRRYCARHHDLQPGERDVTTKDFLQNQFGFSSDMIDSFFRPWLSGIFFETQLETSAQYFCFVFRNLAAGPVAYPRSGIQAIPNQLVERLGKQNIRLECPVQSVTAGAVRLRSGETLTAENVVLAVGTSTARTLLENSEDRTEQPGTEAWSSTACLYYGCSEKPTQEKSLLLNGEGQGPVNHAIVLSNTVDNVAPEGQSLVSVNLVDQAARDYFCSPTEIESQVQEQLQDWFGKLPKDWKLLRAFPIPKALPRQAPGFYRGSSPYRPEDGIYLCGDQMETSSLQGALLSGRLTAESLLDKSSS